MKHEASFNSYFNKWVKNVYRQTAAFELKQTQGASLAYTSVKPHQIEALLNAKHSTLVFKIPDAGYQNPFDCFSLSGVPAFVVVRFGSGAIYGIDIDDFIRSRDNATRKSLTEDEARVIHNFSLDSIDS